jgi:hypothetical protein
LACSHRSENRSRNLLSHCPETASPTIPPFANSALARSFDTSAAATAASAQEERTGFRKSLLDMSKFAARAETPNSTCGKFELGVATKSPATKVLSLLIPLSFVYTTSSLFIFERSKSRNVILISEHESLHM